MNHVVWYVSGSCTWEEALRHLWGQGHVHRDDVRRLLELPNADAVPQWQIEDVLRATQGGPSGLIVRQRILRHVPKVAALPPSAPPRSSVVEARHELRLSSHLMQRLRALVIDLPWTMGDLHMEEAIQIPSVDRRLNNESVLLQVAAFYSNTKAQGLSATPPPPL